MNIEKEEVVASAIGTVGTTAGIGTAFAGASAATMTSTLAGIGAAVGGGMAAGIAVTAAAPLAVGAAVFGATKLIKRRIRGY